MSAKAKQRAVGNRCGRQARRGIRRFEVTAPETDRSLIHALARRLSEGGPKAERARATAKALIADDLPPVRGGILAALRRSPLVGADLDLSRPRVERRKIAL